MRRTTLLITIFLSVMATLTRGVGAAETNAGATAPGVVFDKAGAAEVSSRMHGDPRVARVAAACPADAFETERPFWRGLAEPRRPSERTCALHPADCYDLCLGWANGSACFDLAQAYEHHSLDVADEFDRQRLHALACAMGYPAGCTNRAAGIRNGVYRDDPFRSASLADKQACEHRSFLIDCDRRGAWGCAMLGQTYRNGEGVAAQAVRAQAAFEASCAINPKFAACDFAKRQLEQMNRPPPVPPVNDGTDTGAD